MRFRSQTSPRRRARYALVAITALVAVTAAAGCSSGAPGQSQQQPASASAAASAGSSTSATAAQTASAAQYQEVLSKAFLGAPPSNLSPVITQTLQTVAAHPLTSQQQDKLMHCMTVSVCDIGPGNITVGIAESNGVNGLRRIWRLEATAQAFAMPQVGKVVYLDAHGDLQTFLANFRSLIAQHVTMIIGAYDFGAAVLPVARQATQAGIDVISYTEDIPGAKIGQDIGINMSLNQCQSWSDEAKQAVQSLGKNKDYALYTGPAGNTYAAAWQPCVKSVLNAAGWHQTVNGNTQWTPQGEQQAGAALIASGKHVDAIFYDYNMEDLIQPFITAHKTPPSTFSQAFDQAWWSLYSKARASGINFDAYVGQPGTASWPIRVAVTAGVEKALGESVPTTINLPEEVSQLSSLTPYYDASLPAETAVPSLAPLSWIKQVLS